MGGTEDFSAGAGADPVIMGVVAVEVFADDCAAASAAVRTFAGILAAS